MVATLVGAGPSLAHDGRGRVALRHAAQRIGARWAAYGYWFGVFVVLDFYWIVIMEYTAIAIPLIRRMKFIDSILMSAFPAMFL